MVAPMQGASVPVTILRATSSMTTFSASDRLPDGAGDERLMRVLDDDPLAADRALQAADVQRRGNEVGDRARTPGSAFSRVGVLLGSGESRRPRLGQALAEERQDVVGLRVVAQHRLREDEITVEVDIEDAARPGDDLDRFEHSFPFLQDPRDQTGRV